VPEDRHFVAPEGSHLVASPRRAAFDPALGSPSIGHVTSSYYSPNLDHAIALALVADGRDLMGETIHCAMESGLRAMKVVDPVFYDKEGKRRDGID
jgi:sarcosine oxidase subunit alpha